MNKGPRPVNLQQVYRHTKLGNKFYMVNYKTVVGTHENQ